MKRVLGSFKHLVLAAVVLVATSAPIVAQQIDGCDDWFIISSSSGRRTYCSISHADAEWCYYDCLTA